MRSVALSTLVWLMLCPPAEAQASRYVSRYLARLFGAEAAAVFTESALARSSLLAEERASAAARWRADSWTASKNAYAAAGVSESFAASRNELKNLNTSVGGSRLHDAAAALAASRYPRTTFRPPLLAATIEEALVVPDEVARASLVHTREGTLAVPHGADIAKALKNSERYNLAPLGSQGGTAFETFAEAPSTTRDEAAIVTRGVRKFLSECGLTPAQQDRVLTSTVLLATRDLMNGVTTSLQHRAQLLISASRLPSHRRVETTQAISRLGLAPKADAWEATELALKFDSHLAHAESAFAGRLVEAAERHLANALRAGNRLDEARMRGTEPLAPPEQRCASSKRCGVTPFEVVAQREFRMRLEGYPEESVAHTLLHAPRAAARFQTWTTLVAKRSSRARPALDVDEAIAAASAIIKSGSTGRRSIEQPRLLKLVKEGITTREHLQHDLARLRKGQIAPLSDKAYDDLRDRTIEAVRGALVNARDDASKEVLRSILEKSRTACDSKPIDEAALQRRLEEIADALERILSAIATASRSSYVA